MKKWLTVIFIIFSLSNDCSGQSGLYYLKDRIPADPFDELTYLSTGINYLSDNTYLGRRDSSLLPYLSPYLAYNLHNGLYIKAMVSYALTPNTGHFDLFTLEAGYDRTLGEHILTGIYLDKYDYQRNSPGIRATIKESGSYYFQYKNELIEPQVNVTFNDGNSLDYVVGLIADHNFRFADNTWNIIPAVTVNVGTMQFYNDYFINRLHKADQNLVVGQVVDNAGSIRPLDIEANVKVSYCSGGWLLNFTPAYMIPLGQAKIRLPNNVINERLMHSFYAELDICYRKERK